MASNKEKLREIYYQKKELGLCPRCGKKNTSGYTYCSECREDQKKRRLAYINSRICPICKQEKLFGNEKSCILCKAKMANDKARKRRLLNG